MRRRRDAWVVRTDTTVDHRVRERVSVVLEAEDATCTRFHWVDDGAEMYAVVELDTGATIASGPSTRREGMMRLRRAA